MLMICRESIRKHQLLSTPPLSSRLLAYSSILTSMNARLSSLNEIQAGVLGKVAACKAPAKPQTF